MLLPFGKAIRIMKVLTILTVAVVAAHVFAPIR